jgi:hypothetical protein
LRNAIPKKAVKPLIEHCNKVGAMTGRSGAQVLAGYLKLMKKHPGYFFSDPWPAKLVNFGGFWLQDDEDEFLSEARSYRDEIERFTVILLKRNLCLEGFNAERFDSEFEFYGKLLCIGCVVPDAMYNREYLRKLEETNAEIAENYRLNPDDRFYARDYNYRFSARSLMYEKMKRVELEFQELEGAAEGKTCELRNKCLCPYGARSLELIKLGHRVEILWKIVEYYHRHWHSTDSYSPISREAKWYHFGEEDFLDLTSREDVLKALEDGRIERIAEERRKYEEATRQG